MDCKNAALLRRRVTCVSLIFAIAAIFLTFCGCGDSRKVSSQSHSTLAVPDSGNNRVLIYNQPFTPGESASVVLGQSGFNTASASTSATGLSDPSAVAVDGAGNLYVLESYNGTSGNNRVVQFKPPFTNGMAATLAINAPDLTTAGSSPITGLAFDPSGNLWISNPQAGQLLKFVPPFTTGMSPALTISPGTPSPMGIAFDGSGNLWVADFVGNRVLEFTAPISASSTAAVTLGGTASPVTATALSAPVGIAFDASGHLWVADSGNNRVLRYTAPFTNGMAADLALGQADLVSNGANRGTTASAATLQTPTNVTFVDGKLVVADSGNNRTLIFNSPFTSGMSATTVLGQADFTSTTANAGAAAPSAATQNAPYNGGNSLLAMAVFVLLVAGWFVAKRRKRQIAA